MERNVFTEAQETWLKALESGEYQQCRKKLHSTSAGIETHCCLGVAERLGLAEANEANQQLFIDDENRLLLRGGDGALLRPELEAQPNLVAMNDHANMTFSEIAAFIRANPWQVFTNFDVPEQRS